MTGFRLQAKRTTNSGPPTDLIFGEVAYSDSDQEFYVGRPTGPPSTFQSDLTPITDGIAALATTTTDQAAVLVALANSDALQDTALAALISNDLTQDTAIGSLIDTTTDQAAAIATFETTAQLNVRDTANRSRDNHTGTQAAATVTGLATVATSGAYGDLTGRPTVPYGFTYDQQAEPVGPAAGATWRERSSGGLIVNEWQWDDEVFRWVEVITRSQIYNVSASGQTFSPFAVQGGILNALATILYLGFKGVFWISTTANASNYYDHRMMTYQKETASGSDVTGGAFTLLTPYASAVMVANTNVPFSVVTKQLISRAGGLIGFRLWVVPTGAPGTFRTIGHVLFKNVRPL